METVSQPESRVDALRSGIRLEMMTIVWMTLEALLAIGAGAIAGSVLLIASGADSVIELISGIVLLILLCLYVAITTVVGLVWRAEPAGSPVGILVSTGALILMPLLARAKRGINQRLGSAALRADIAESTTCAYMAGTVLVGLALNAALGWWWAEYVAAAALLYWLVGETREAFEAA